MTRRYPLRHHLLGLLVQPETGALLGLALGLWFCWSFLGSLRADRCASASETVRRAC